MNLNFFNEKAFKNHFSREYKEKVGLYKIPQKLFICSVCINQNSFQLKWKIHIQYKDTFGIQSGLPNKIPSVSEI